MSAESARDDAAKKRAVATKSFVFVSPLSILIELAEERRDGHVCVLQGALTNTTGRLRFVMNAQHYQRPAT